MYLYLLASPRGRRARGCCRHAGRNSPRCVQFAVPRSFRARLPPYEHLEWDPAGGWRRWNGCGARLHVRIPNRLGTGGARPWLSHCGFAYAAGKPSRPPSRARQRIGVYRAPCHERQRTWVVLACLSSPSAMSAHAPTLFRPHMAAGVADVARSRTWSSLPTPTRHYRTTRAVCLLPPVQLHTYRVMTSGEGKD